MRGKIKPVNAVNNGPEGMSARGTTNFEDYAALEIPYARNHDASFYSAYGGEHTVDVHRIFRNFDVDEAPAEEVCLKVKGLNVPKGVRVEYYLVDEQHDNKLMREEKFTSGEFTLYLSMKLFDICLIKLVAIE